jgi:hypothetical protein
MKVARVINGLIVEDGELQDMFPNVAFPVTGPSKDWLDSHQLVAVSNDLTYDPHTQRLEPCHCYWIGHRVYDVKVVDLSEADQAEANAQAWGSIKAMRQRMFNSQQWRIDRWNREERMGLPHTDDIKKLDKFFHDLSNITNQPDPWNITWPDVPPENQ